MKYAPPPLRTLTVTVAILVSLAPSLLPRPPIMQGIVTGLLAALAYALAVLAGRVLVAIRNTPEREPRESAQVLALLFSAIAVSWAVVATDHWQDGLRLSMGMPTIGPSHWAQATVCGALTFLVLFGAGNGLGRLARRVGRPGAVTAIVVGVVGAQVIGPAAAAMLSESYSESNSVIEASVDRPLATERDGGAAVRWETLGREGRRFVAAGDRSPAIRTYVGLNSADDTNTRAALAVSELDRAGGFDKSAVVVAVPTGSGWIDASAASGIEQRFGGDVAIVGLQYSFAPSWVTFLFARDAADESATALLSAVTEHVSGMPTDRRPDIYVYGQSLGSVGGSAALADSDARASVCGILWAGPPAGSVDTRGATVLANTSDPVVWWSPKLITTPPDLDSADRDAPIPAWLPGISFVQTSVDLLTALSVPPGHGHRYGTEQGTALPECEAQEGELIGPRAASYAAPTR
ncbi:MAG: hypothetical protein GX610_09755 [Rhodococcus sp.]|nr:hypothetical protein [Rhodococcus sp. (in: high G+C Gram-positive bacteria)]